MEQGQITADLSGCQDAQVEVLPYSDSAECVLIGSAVFKRELWLVVSALVSAGHFHSKEFRAAWELMIELSSKGLPFDIWLLADQLARGSEFKRRQLAALLSDAVAYATDDVEILKRHAQTVKDCATQREWLDFAVELVRRAKAGSKDDELRAMTARFASDTSRTSNTHIQSFAEIPDIQSLTIPDIQWAVDGMIARYTVTQVTGTDGSVKSILALRMGLEVSRGGEFLGRQCRKCPVLYLDYENPSFAVRERVDAMGVAPADEFKVWGTWLEEQPPPIGSALLLKIAKERQPLMIFDPFRYGHNAEENDASQMVVIMRHLRSYAAVGAAVLFLHHPAKVEGSTGRGSSVIRGAVDVAFMQEKDPQSGLIKLSCVKNRFGATYSVTVKPDYDFGSFEVADSPEFSERQDELETIAKVIREHPGLTQNELTGFLPMTKQRAIKLVKSQVGILWETKTGPRNSLLYYSLDRFSKSETSQKTSEPLGQKSALVSRFSPLKGETAEPVTAPEPFPNNGKTLPSCPVCGGFAVDSRTDPLTCFKCEAEGGGRVQ